MKALVEYLARALARHPDQVVVEEERFGDRIVLRLTVADEDKGRIIGREGRIANAIRSLLYVAATRAGVRATLDIE
ncbi:MAG: KH domain-containing protein [Dehalococcoidia bacterium]|nr:KH domain-containing protein [Dehalococcoidia bacterium]